jgi:hypothetical protein
LGGAKLGAWMWPRVHFPADEVRQSLSSIRGEWDLDPLGPSGRLA